MSKDFSCTLQSFFRLVVKLLGAQGVHPAPNGAIEFQAIDFSRLRKLSSLSLRDDLLVFFIFVKTAKTPKVLIHFLSLHTMLAADAAKKLDSFGLSNFTSTDKPLKNIAPPELIFLGVPHLKKFWNKILALHKLREECIHRSRKLPLLVFRKNFKRIAGIGNIHRICRMNCPVHRPDNLIERIALRPRIKKGLKLFFVVASARIMHKTNKLPKTDMERI